MTTVAPMATIAWNSKEQGVRRPSDFRDAAAPEMSRHHAEESPRERVSTSVRAMILGTVVLLLAITPATGQTSVSATAEVPIELRPYRVRVSIGFDSAPEFTASYRRTVVTDLLHRLERTFGAMWDLAVLEDDWLLPVRPTTVQRLSEESFARRNADVELDKWFVVVIEDAGSGYRLTACEWDASSQQLSSAHKRTTWDRRAVAEQACHLVGALFQPVVLIDQVEEDRVNVRIQAGEFPAVDPAAAQLRPGDVLEPYFRYLDQEKTLRKVQSLPWTYLVVESVDRSRAVCRVKTGLRASLGGAARLVEKAARRIQPIHESTRLTLQVRGRGAKPLAGYQVSLRPDRNEMQPDGESADALKPQELLTDRWGTVRVPHDPARPLTWMSVRSGKTLLARVPYVPGVHPEVTLELPDDSIRLDVEGQIAVVTADLVDTVARQAVLMAQIRSSIGTNDWERVDALMNELNRMPGYAHYESRVRNIRVTATELAQEKGDRLAEARVRSLCRDALNVVAKYLDEDRLRDFRGEVTDARPSEPRRTNRRPRRR